MQRLRAYTFQLKPNDDQVRAMRQYLMSAHNADLNAANHTLRAGHAHWAHLANDAVKSSVAGTRPSHLVAVQCQA